MKKKKLYLKSYKSKPANYILWKDGLDYYVSRRVNLIKEVASLEHFVGFFESEKDAWKSAEERTLMLISTLQNYISRFKKNSKKEN